MWRPPLRRLYRDLVGPIADRGYLKNKKRLVIVPHADLHFLSFAALLDAADHDRFLVERYDIVYAPSASAWVRLGERNLKPRGKDVLAMAPHVDRLPASRREVGAIQSIYGHRASIRTGKEASEKALRSSLKSAGTIHLATFGVLNRHNPLFSFVQLASNDGSDGRLQVNEVFGLGLSGQLVVLSACQTALGAGNDEELPPGDDWVGLVQAFLQGGAKSVVASLWPVDDSATASLMERFHRQVAGGRSTASALSGAQREMLRNSKTGSPFYWAAFVMNGS
jgi:CHAT domain-containing protein